MNPETTARRHNLRLAGAVWGLGIPLVCLLGLALAGTPGPPPQGSASVLAANQTIEPLAKFANQR